MNVISTPQDFMKSLGRDGAYVELSPSDLVKADLSHVKFLVMTAARFDISDTQHLELLKKAIEAAKQSPETKGMSEEQVGAWMVRRIFEKGLEHGI